MIYIVKIITKPSECYDNYITALMKKLLITMTITFTSSYKQNKRYPVTIRLLQGFLSI